MIVNTVQVKEAEYIGDIKENRVGIDRANIDFITTLLTSNLYSNPLQSFLRETVTNAYDSCVEAGTPGKSIIMLIQDKDSRNFTISIRDYGTGVSPERFNKIYKNIGSSTKRESNDYMGMFGIGRLSCLSVVDVAEINSYYNGTKYSYLMYKNGMGINIDEVSQTHGNYRNGLEVVVELTKDISNLIELKKGLLKLILFDSLEVRYIGNSSTIIEAVEKFNSVSLAELGSCWLTPCTFTAYHKYVAVGKVIYELDLKTPGITYYTEGIIAKLPVGSVDIVPSREALQLTDRTKNTLIATDIAVKKDLQKLVTDKLKNIVAQGSIEHYYRSFLKLSYGLRIECGTIKPLLIDSRDINRDYSTLNLSIQGFPITSEFNSCVTHFYTSSVPQEQVFMQSSNLSNVSLARLQENFNNLEWFIKGDDAFRSQTKLYLRELGEQHKIIVLKKDALIFWKNSLKTHFPNTLSDAQSNDLIDKLIESLHIKTFYNADVPESFIQECKSKATKKVINTQTTARLYYQNSYSEIAPHYRNAPLKTILEGKKPIIYGINTTDSAKYGELTYFLRDKFKVITVAKKDLPLLEHNRKCIRIEELLTGKKKFLMKKVTADIVLREIERFYSIYDYNITTYLPEVRNVKNKYSSYGKIDSLCSLGTQIRDIYKERGWIYQEDIDACTLSDGQKAMLEDIYNIKNNREAIINRIIYRKYHGKVALPKLKPIYKNTYENI